MNLEGWNHLRVSIRGEINGCHDAPGGPPGRIALLAGLDDVLVAARAELADARASLIADAVNGSTTRQVALDLGLSPAAVAKAVARARASTGVVSRSGPPA